VGRRHSDRMHFVPASPCATGESVLESRVLLSGGAENSDLTAEITLADLRRLTVQGRRVPSSLIGSATRGIQIRDSSTTRITDAIDRSFDAFTADYLQAQSAYLASVTTETRSTFLSVTQQRVNLLAQELTQTLARVPGTLKRANSSPTVPLNAFLNRRITSTHRPLRVLQGQRSIRSRQPTQSRRRACRQPMRPNSQPRAFSENSD
jgi:hypothetical protein